MNLRQGGHQCAEKYSLDYFVRGARSGDKCRERRRYGTKANVSRTATHMTCFFPCSASDDGTSSPATLSNVGPNNSSNWDVMMTFTVAVLLQFQVTVLSKSRAFSSNGG